MEATRRVNEGMSCDLLTRLAEDERFPMTLEQIMEVINPADFVGRCPQQVDEFLDSIHLDGGETASDDDIKV